MEQFTSKGTAGIGSAKLGMGVERRKIPASMDDSTWSIEWILRAYKVWLQKRTGRCRCKKADVPCTELCQWGGGCI